MQVPGNEEEEQQRGGGPGELRERAEGLECGVQRDVGELEELDEQEGDAAEHERARGDEGVVGGAQAGPAKKLLNTRICCCARWDLPCAEVGTLAGEGVARVAVGVVVGDCDDGHGGG